MSVFRDTAKGLTVRPPSGTVGHVVSTFQRQLFLPDPRPLLAVLGSVAANRLPGDPVWLVLVGAPGCGKSELIVATYGLEEVHPAATLTEGSLLSGTSRKERAKHAKGGLLREIGDFGILACKDFGSVLSMHREARGQALAALREVYDGAWTRHVGTDGGQTLHWEGKCGLVAGCTPTIDSHHAVMAAMGERFILHRFPKVDRAELARQARGRSGGEREMRRELEQAVRLLFEAPPGDVRALTDEEGGRLDSLAMLVTQARSTVERDGHTREIVLVSDPEAPTRLVKALERLLAGLDAIGVDRAVAWDVVTKAGRDSIPALRLRVLDTLAATVAPLATPAVADKIGHPTRTTLRALEDLAAHEVAARYSQSEGKAHLWALHPDARELYQVGVPEMSDGAEKRTAPEMSGRDKNEENPASREGFFISNSVVDDISGTVPPRLAGESPADYSPEQGSFFEDEGPK